VLITGESGTGKELVARALHKQEHDPITRPFIAFNCGALQESLVESELFGHEKGAYTDAKEEYNGKFLAADGGDIFLDEVGELSSNVQKKLLRVIQERIVTPVGSTKSIPVNVRIIAATNRNLEHEVARGNFREDLFYRLNVIRINVPPLRKRTDEIPVLAKYFINKFLPGSKISDEAIDFLKTQVWLGNVRELEHCLESSCNRVRGDGRRIIEKDDVAAHSFVSRGHAEDALPSWILPKNTSQINPEHFQEAIDWIERSYLERALMLHGESRTLVAEGLHVSRSHVQRRLKKLGFIEEKDSRDGKL
jgi:transcriptional regulator with PAS, ATPase and Fis domain